MIVLIPDLNGNPVPLFVLFRPEVKAFIEKMSKLYEVVVFTAGEEHYASKVLDQLDPNGDIFSGRLYRDSCTICNGIYIKDLTKLGRPLSDVIIVDNSPYAYYF